MAYEELPADWIEAGKPTKEEIFQNLKDNQESFNTDIELLKQTATIDIFDFSVTGFVSDYTNTEITATAQGSLSGSVSFVSPASQLFDQNDLLRVRIVGVQVNQGKFHISVYGELSQ